ncbi:MAG: hypothetical protein ABR950_06360 [Candidatus Dormibacteria bacterium]|jgi:hypothetical protein
MEPSQSAAAVEGPQEIVAKIDQKAVRLSALLRDIDNHPIELPTELIERLDEILEMLGCRISATRALLHQPAFQGMSVA